MLEMRIIRCTDDWTLIKTVGEHSRNDAHYYIGFSGASVTEIVYNEFPGRDRNLDESTIHAIAEKIIKDGDGDIYDELYKIVQEACKHSVGGEHAEEIYSELEYEFSHILNEECQRIEVRR